MIIGYASHKGRTKPFFEHRFRNFCLLSEPRLARINRIYDKPIYKCFIKCRLYLFKGFSGLCNARCNPVNPLIGGILVQTFSGSINSLKFQFVCSKIYQKPNLHFICFQIVFCLCQMNIFKSGQCFKFHHNQIFNKKINPASSNLNVFVKNGHFHFSSKIQTSFLHLNFQCPLVNNFLKTISKNAMNIHSTANNFMSNQFVLHNPVNPLIRGIVVQTFLDIFILADKNRYNKIAPLHGNIENVNQGGKQDAK